MKSAFALSALIGAAHAWDYLAGGEDWQEGDCRTGINQSPININKMNEFHRGYLKSSLSAFKKDQKANVTQDKKGILNVGSCGAALIGQLDQVRGAMDPSTKNWQEWTGTVSSIEVHQPSEHMILGEGHPLEVQVYFGNEDVNGANTEAAVGILFKVVADWKLEDLGNTSVATNTQASCQKTKDETDAKNFETYEKTKPDEQKKKDDASAAAADYTICIEKRRAICWQSQDFFKSISSSGVQSVDLQTLTQNINPEFFYEYSGSLTTPPCTEGITWNVMSKAVPICQAEYNAIVKANKDSTTVPGRGNNRRVQKDYHTVASDVCKKEEKDGKMVCKADGSMVMKEVPRKIFFSSPPGGSFSGAFSTTISMVAAGVAAAACLF